MEISHRGIVGVGVVALGGISVAATSQSHIPVGESDQHHNGHHTKTDDYHDGHHN
jgi:hypothetical protein